MAPGASYVVGSSSEDYSSEESSVDDVKDYEAEFNQVDDNEDLLEQVEDDLVHNRNAAR